MITRDKRWKIFPLYTYGTWYNAHRCTQTVEALRCIPDLKLAMFSILQPHKEIPPHRGPYSGVLRYHLGLQIPDPALAGIRVGSDVRHWEEGGSLIFDDSHDHAAWNRSDRDRIVLFVDFARPLPSQLRKQNEYVIDQISKSDFMLHAAARWKRWEAIHGASLDARISA
jgi:beta-hydroxylase